MATRAKELSDLGNSGHLNVHDDGTVTLEGGNVGIGTNNPTNLLHVKSTVNNGGVITIESTATDSYPFLRLKNDAREYQITAHGPLSDIFTIYDGTAGSHRLVISSSGNVGIGTTGPGFRLHAYHATTNVVGKIESGDDEVWLALTDVGTDSYGTLIGRKSSTNTLFKVADENVNERFTILEGGNVGIGTTSPQQILHIHNSSGNFSAEAVLTGRLSTGTPKAEVAFKRGTSGDGAMLVLRSSNSSGALIDAVTIKDGTGNVGIGTTSPSEALHVFDSSSATDSQGIRNSTYRPHLTLEDLSTNAGDWQVWADGGDLSFLYGDVSPSGTNGAKLTSLAMRIDSSGNVGIGTNNPGKKLDVYGEARIRTGLTITPATSTVYATDSTLSSYATGNGVYLNGHGSGWLRLNASGANRASIDMYGENYAAPFTDAIVFKTGNTGNRMMIATNGNVGIGTTSPTSILSIEKNSSRTTDYENMLKITHTSSGTTGVGFGSAIYFVGERNNGVNQAMGRLVFDAEVNSGSDISSGFSVQTATAGSTSEKFRITHDGKVGIGTISPGAKLTITDENAGQAMLQVRNYATSATGGFGNAHSVEFRSATSTTVHGALIHHQEDNIGRRTLDVSDANGIFASFVQGKVGIGTTSPGAKLAIKDGSTGAVNFLEFHYDDPGGDLDGVGNEEILVNYKFTDQNSNNTPQVQVAAELGNPGHTDLGTTSEGRGNYVVRTNDGATGGLSDSLRVEWDGSVHMPQQPAALYYDITENASVAQSELIGFATAAGWNRGITDSNSKTRFFVPTAGIYAVAYTVSGSLTTPSAGDGIRVLIKKNGATYANANAYNIETVGTVAGQEYTFRDMLLVDLGVNHYIELMFDNVGGTVFLANFGNINIWKVA